MPLLVVATIFGTELSFYCLVLQTEVVDARLLDKLYQWIYQNV